MSDRESTNKAATATTESLCDGSETKVAEICLDPDKAPHCGNCIHGEVISARILQRILASVYFYVRISQFVDVILIMLLGFKLGNVQDPWQSYLLFTLTEKGFVQY